MTKRICSVIMCLTQKKIDKKKGKMKMKMESGQSNCKTLYWKEKGRIRSDEQST